MIKSFITTSNYTRSALELLLWVVSPLVIYYMLTPKKKADDNESSNDNKEDKVITTLTESRGSDGMGLPTELSKKTIDTIVATAPVVGPRALEITSAFYKKVIGKHPGLLSIFNPAHNVPISLHQPKALAGAIVAYASNITDLSPLVVPGGPVDAICHRHAALCLYPAQYVVVYENLMETIGEVLGSDVVTEEIAAAWSEAVLFLAKVFIDQEESLYQMAEQRSGGWSGLMDFRVSEITTVAKDIKSFSFQPPSGSELERKAFNFTLGQYLSIKVDPKKDGLTAPRHYTVTSPPDANYLQCTVKKLKGGVVSTYLHEQLQVGDIVQLAAPFGVFTIEDTNEVKSAVLISAGIGVTPMINFQRALKDKVQLSVHVDSTPESYAYRELFNPSDDNQTTTKTLEKYTRVGKGGRPNIKQLVQEIIDIVDGPNHNFYICGPESWMDAVQKELMEHKAQKVMCEVFGSQLATGCPFFASS